MNQVTFSWIMNAQAKLKAGYAYPYIQQEKECINYNTKTDHKTGVRGFHIYKDLCIVDWY